MNIQIKCYACSNDVPIVNKKIKNNLKSSKIIFEIGFCGYCETMAYKVSKDINNTVKALMKEN